MTQPSVTQFISNNIGLVAVFVASGVMMVWPLIAKVVFGQRELGTLDATQLMNNEGALVLDVRENAEFNAGHIAGAVNIPFRELEKRVSDLERHKGKPLLVVGRPGAATATAMRLLRGKGFDNAYQLKGGIDAWKDAQLPLKK